MTKNNSVTLPNFLIVGAAKSGTTSLYNYLKAHPEIFMSEQKEPCFFSSYKVDYDIFKKNVYPVGTSGKDTLLRSFNEYIQLFKKANYKDYIAIGEASTHYLFQYKETIKNLKDIYKKYNYDPEKIKIIIIIRNPIEAAYSNYTMWYMNNKEEETFEKAINSSDKRLKNDYLNIAYINKFKYFKQIKEYKNNFKNVKVFLFEELKNNPKELLEEIYDFLELNNTDLIPKNMGKKYNPSGYPKIKLIERLFEMDNIIKNILKLMADSILTKKTKKKLIKEIKKINLEKHKMNSNTKKILIEEFKDDIIKTQILIDKDLSDWLKIDQT